MSGGQVKQSEITLGPLRRSDLNSKLSCRAINHPSANPLEATVQIDMNCKYLSSTIHRLCPGDTFVVLSSYWSFRLVSRNGLSMLNDARQWRRRSASDYEAFCCVLGALRSGVTPRTAFWDADAVRNPVGNDRPTVHVGSKERTQPFHFHHLIPPFIDFGADNLERIYPSNMSLCRASLGSWR